MTDFAHTYNGCLPSRSILRSMWNYQITDEVLKTVLQKQNEEIAALYNSTTVTIRDRAGNAISESKHFSS